MGSLSPEQDIFQMYGDQYMEILKLLFVIPMKQARKGKGYIQNFYLSIKYKSFINIVTF